MKTFEYEGKKVELSDESYAAMCKAIEPDMEIGSKFKFYGEVVVVTDIRNEGYQGYSPRPQVWSYDRCLCYLDRISKSPDMEILPNDVGGFKIGDMVVVNDTTDSPVVSTYHGILARVRSLDNPLLKPDVITLDLSDTFRTELYVNVENLVKVREPEDQLTYGAMPLLGN